MNVISNRKILIPIPAKITVPSERIHIATYFVNISCPQKDQYRKRMIQGDSQNWLVSMNSFVDKWFPPGTPKGASHTTVIKHNPITSFFSTKLIGGQHDLLSLLTKIIYTNYDGTKLIHGKIKKSENEISLILLNLKVSGQHLEKFQFVLSTSMLPRQPGWSCWWENVGEGVPGIWGWQWIAGYFRGPQMDLGGPRIFCPAALHWRQPSDEARNGENTFYLWWIRGEGWFTPPRPSSRLMRSSRDLQPNLPFRWSVQQPSCTSGVSWWVTLAGGAPPPPPAAV